MSGDAAEANRLLQEAADLATPRKWLFFNAAPKYQEASEMYNRAGNLLKTMKEWRAAGDAFTKAADMDVAMGEPDESARKLISATSCFKKVDAEAAINVLVRAIAIFLKGGRFHIAATHEKEVAELYETQLRDYENATKYYEVAADRYSAEDSMATAQSCSLKAAALSALAEDYAKAISIFEESASSAVSDNLRKFNTKEYLFKAGLCHLCTGDLIAARRSIERYPQIDASFASSREFKCLMDLIEAMEQDEVEKFTEVVAEYDRVSQMDDWKTKMLLRAKRSIKEEASLT